jgi:hypothetical protein
MSGPWLAITRLLLTSLFCSPVAVGQNDPGRGWLEGVIVTDKGKPTCGDWNDVNLSYCGAAHIAVRPKEGNGVRTDSDTQKGGFYTLRNLKPGLYEVFVDKSAQMDREERIRYRPLHVFGVIVEPDKRTVLNLTVHQGDSLEEVGKPNVNSEKAIILAEELSRLRKEIEELKRIYVELSKK